VNSVIAALRSNGPASVAHRRTHPRSADAQDPARRRVRDFGEPRPGDRRVAPGAFELRGCPTPIDGPGRMSCAGRLVVAIDGDPMTQRESPVGLSFGS
jgi:hypothetical protein